MKRRDGLGSLTGMLAAAALAGLLVGLGLRVFRVRSTSMSPTLRPGDMVLGVRSLGAPRRGELVALQGRDHWRLKRLVAVGGDAVALRGTQLFRNQSRIGEPYARYSQGGILDLPAVVLPPGQVVALGDHRDASLDSRQLGTFPLRAARYRLLVRLWPPARAGWLD